MLHVAEHHWEFFVLVHAPEEEGGGGQPHTRHSQGTVECLYERHRLNKGHLSNEGTVCNPKQSCVQIYLKLWTPLYTGSWGPMVSSI